MFDRKQYYLDNRDKILAQVKEHKKTYIDLSRRDYKSNLRMLLKKAQRRKNKEFNLVPDDLYEIWDKQNGLCAYSKVPLKIEANHLETCSLDRINSSLGYVKGNVQLVCAIVNRMKQEFSEEDFLFYCELITNANKKTTHNNGLL